MKTSLFFATLAAFLVATVGHAEHWSTGYYRTVEDPGNSYYYNDEYRWYCHIQNQTQANLFNVDQQVREVGDIFVFLNQAVGLGECLWPNGFYREDNEDSIVYRLYPGNICAITSDAMLAAYGGSDLVITAEVGSSFGAHRTMIGQCFWPSWDLTDQGY